MEKPGCGIIFVQSNFLYFYLVQGCLVQSELNISLLQLFIQHLHLPEKKQDGTYIRFNIK